MTCEPERSREDFLIKLKQDLDKLGLDRNVPSTFSNCAPAIREQATALIFAYLEMFNDCAIALLYKELLQLDNILIVSATRQSEFGLVLCSISQNALKLTTNLLRLKRQIARSW